ncbi:hypothetical protein A1D29_09910 [Pasteurellaceae bacterium Orientalotternb1]|nr:hypothetical protein A1D29_09910 [Pasteurellaceae bacterium Orientalotternb1]
MKNWILDSHIKPNKISYNIFYAINHHLLLILFTLSTAIIFYPAFSYLNLYFSNKEQNRIQIELAQKMKQHAKLLISLKQNQEKQNSSKISFNQINQQIQDLLSDYQVKVENLQWQFDQESQLYLTIHHQSNTLFSLINKLNQIESLSIKQITLTKLNQQKLVELNGIFLLVK